MPLISVIIPVYNEKNTIVKILDLVQAVEIEKEIIIIDDFSTDGSRDIISSINANNIQVILHGNNCGKGYIIVIPI